MNLGGAHAQGADGRPGGQGDHRAHDQVDHAAALHARVRQAGGVQEERQLCAPDAAAVHLPGERAEHPVRRHSGLHAHELDQDGRAARLPAQRPVRPLRSAVRAGRLREDQHSRRLLLLRQRLPERASRSRQLLCRDGPAHGQGDREVQPGARRGRQHARGCAHGQRSVRLHRRQALPLRRVVGRRHARQQDGVERPRRLGPHLRGHVQVPRRQVQHRGGREVLGPLHLLRDTRDEARDRRGRAQAESHLRQQQQQHERCERCCFGRRRDRRDGCCSDDWRRWWQHRTHHEHAQQSPPPSGQQEERQQRSPANSGQQRRQRRGSGRVGASPRQQRRS